MIAIDTYIVLEVTDSEGGYVISGVPAAFLRRFKTKDEAKAVCHALYYAHALGRQEVQRDIKTALGLE